MDLLGKDTTIALSVRQSILLLSNQKCVCVIWSLIFARCGVLVFFLCVQVSLARDSLARATQKHFALLVLVHSSCTVRHFINSIYDICLYHVHIFVRKVLIYSPTIR